MLAARARPLFARAHGKQWWMLKPLRAALEWWSEALSRRIVETRAWLPDRRLPRAFAVRRARGTAAARRGALVGGRRVAPPAEWLRRAIALAAPARGGPASSCRRLFRERNDAQIAGLEILVIAVGLSTFAEALRGCEVRIFSDSVLADGALRRGAARAFHRHGLIHGARSFALAERIHAKVDRFSSKLNMSDMPSREERGLLERLGATRLAPKIAPAFLRRGFA